MLENGASSHRKVLDNYSSETLDEMITIVISILIMSYSLYTFLAKNILLMATIPLIIYGIFRYTLIIHSKNVGGEPEMLFKDKGILLSIVSWVILILWILYLKI